MKQQKSKVFEPLRSRRAQIQMGELIMVVMIVMILLILGLVGYSMFRQDDIRVQGEETASLSAVELAQEAAGMQELSCGFSTEFSYCIDEFRASAFSTTLGTAPPNSPVYNYYFDKFGLARITLDMVYPSAKSWTLYNQTGLAGNELPLRLPVYIYNPVNKTNGFGFLTVVRFR